MDGERAGCGERSRALKAMLCARKCMKDAGHGGHVGYAVLRHASDLLRTGGMRMQYALRRSPANGAKPLTRQPEKGGQVMGQPGGKTGLQTADDLPPSAELLQEIIRLKRRPSQPQSPTADKEGGGSASQKDGAAAAPAMSEGGGAGTGGAWDPTAMPGSLPEFARRRAGRMAGIAKKCGAMGPVALKAALRNAALELRRAEKQGGGWQGVARDAVVQAAKQAGKALLAEARRRGMDLDGMWPASSVSGTSA